MHARITKLAVALLLIGGIIACNSKKEEKKEPGPDTSAVKPAPAPMPADTMKLDTASTRPVKTPD